MIAKHATATFEHFGHLATYIAAAKDPGEKLHSLWLEGFHAGTEADDLAFAILEANTTQKMNARAKKMNYHLIVSFRSDDKIPTKEELKEIERAFAKALGFEEHQRVVGTHQNTDNFHMHVAYNRIHPETFKSHDPAHDFRKLSAVCKEMEEKYGLAVDRHMGEEEDKSPRYASDMEAHTWEESLESYIIDRHGAALKEGMAKANTWQEAHQLMYRYGLHLKLRGNGLVIGDAQDGKHHIKASTLDRDCSKPKLEERFGSFEPFDKSLVKDMKILDSYKKRPATRHRNTPKYWNRYRSNAKALTFKEFLISEAIHDALARQIVYSHKIYITERKAEARPSRSITRPVHKTYLDVPFDQRDAAKEAGAKWDKKKGRWYVPAHMAQDEAIRPYLPPPPPKPEDEFKAVLEDAGAAPNSIIVKDGHWHTITSADDKPAMMYQVKKGRSKAPILNYHRVNSLITKNYTYTGQYEREADRKAHQVKLKKRIYAMTMNAVPAPADHAFFVDHQMDAAGFIMDPKTTALILPLQDINGDIQSAYQVKGSQKENDRLTLVKGGRHQGLFHVVNGDDAAPPVHKMHDVIITTDPASAAAIHKATGQPVLVAFRDDNLSAVATEVRAANSAARIRIAGTMEPATMRAARKAAKQVNGEVVSPQFSFKQEILQSKRTFNDLYAIHGLSAIRKAFPAVDKEAYSQELIYLKVPYQDRRTVQELGAIRDTDGRFFVPAHVANSTVGHHQFKAWLPPKPADEFTLMLQDILQDTTFKLHKNNMNGSWHHHGGISYRVVDKTLETEIAGKTTRHDYTGDYVPAAIRKQHAEKATRRANGMYRHAEQATADHPYLLRTGIAPDGLKVNPHTDAIIIPLYDTQNRIQSACMIGANGRQSRLQDGNRTDLFAIYNGANPHPELQRQDQFIMTDSLQNAAQIHKATGKPVYVAMSDEDMEGMAQSLLANNPKAQFTFITGEALSDTHPAVQATYGHVVQLSENDTEQSIVQKIPKPGQRHSPRMVQLNVPYQDRKMAKAVGALWNATKETFEIPIHQQDRAAAWIPTPEKEFLQVLADHGIKCEALPKEDFEIWHKVNRDDGQPPAQFRIRPKTQTRPAKIEIDTTDGQKPPVSHIYTGAYVSTEERQIRARAASKKAYGIVMRAKDATKDTPVLKKAGLRPDGLGVDDTGNVVIPLTDARGYIKSVAYMDKAGHVSVLPDSDKTGAFYLMSGEATLKDCKDVIVCPDMMTAAALRETTGKPIAVAMSEDNMTDVIRGIGKANPRIKVAVHKADEQAIEKQQALEKTVQQPAKTKKETSTLNPETYLAQRKASKTAFAISNGLKPANPNHPYLINNNIISLMAHSDKAGRIALPLQDTNGMIWSMTFIDENGRHSTLKNSRKEGVFHLSAMTFGAVNLQKEKEIYLCKDLATAARIRETTDAPIAITNSDKNTQTVAKELRKINKRADLRIGMPEDATATTKQQLTAAAKAVNAEVFTIKPDNRLPLERAMDQSQKNTHEITAWETRAAMELLKPVSSKHPYLIENEIISLGLMEDEAGRIALPLQDINGEIWSMAYIDDKGRYSGPKDGRRDGVFNLYHIGDQAGLDLKKATEIHLCKDLATAARIRKTTDAPIAITMNDENSKTVAKELQQINPSVKLIITEHQNIKQQKQQSPNLGM